VLNEYHAKDKSNAYYLEYLPKYYPSFAIDNFIIKNADLGSLEALHDRYARDKNNLYYKGKKNKGADSKTFKVMRDGVHAKDKNHRYNCGGIINH